MGRKHGFIRVHDVIKNLLESNPFVNTVSYGDTSRVDINKQTIYSLAHFYLSGISEDRQTKNYTFTLILADLMDITKDSEIDNELFIHDTFDMVISSLMAKLREGDISHEGYKLSSSEQARPFKEDYQNTLAGLQIDFTVMTKNEIDLC